MIQNMKVLFLTTWYPNKKNPYKGIFVKLHAKAIAAFNPEIKVLALHIVDDPKIFKISTEVNMDENGIETHHIYVLSRFHKKLNALTPLLYFICKNYFNKHIQKDWQPGLIHGNIIHPAGIIAYKLAKSIKVKFIISEHWSKIDHFMTKNLFAKSAKKAFDYANKITTVSNFLKQKVSQYADANKIEVVPNLVDSHFKFNAQQSNLNEIQFTAVATWEKPKMPELFVEALNSIQLEIPQKIILNMIGNGSQLQAILKQKHNIQINPFGIKNSREIAEILNKSDYFLHASTIETFSIVIAEALSCGVPVCASNVGAIPDLIHVKNGVLVENNLSSWTAGILQLMKTTYYREEISVQSARKFQMEAISNQFKIIYQTVENMPSVN
jgi:glycosyltransferase involved in cell wall biosynthesis